VVAHGGGTPRSARHCGDAAQSAYDPPVARTELAALTNPGPRPANSWVYFDGQIVRYHDVHLGLMTHALHYGTGCFEGIRAYWNERKEQLYVLQGHQHFDRLRRSARVLRMELPLDTESLVKITLELLRRNEFRTDTYIRPILFKSTEEIGVRLHGLAEAFAIYTVPFGNYVEIDAGIRCMVSSWRRVSDESVPARAKITGAYINSALAKSEAVEAGLDEAIVLSSNGHVSEGSAENIFIVKDGTLVTPAVTDDILEGVTRKLVMSVGRDELRMPVVERSIDRTELYTCDEVFLVGTGAQISPVIEVDRRPVGNGQVGEVTRELQHIYFDACRGENPKYAGWTIPVY
jgi:branched-chain amino acid aminotransferase